MFRINALIALLASCMLASAALPETMGGRDLKNGKGHSHSSYAKRHKYLRYCVLAAIPNGVAQTPVESNTDNLYDCANNNTSAANAIGQTTFICGPGTPATTDRLLCERVFVIGDTGAIYSSYVRREQNNNTIEFPILKSTGDVPKKFVNLEREVGVAGGVPAPYFARWVLKYVV